MKSLTKIVSRLRSRVAQFAGDQSGQGIILAAASLVLLVVFVALVFNIGRVVDRRTKVQLAADAAAYSGATVEANSLSAIAWINSAMAQLYYNAVKYSADVNTALLAAELERRENRGVLDRTMPKAAAYRQAFDRANNGLPKIKQWMIDLSRIENSIAILTPRLVQEEMFAVATYSDPQARLESPADALSFHPSFRMFPHAERTVSYSIERLGNGWKITNLHGGNNDVLSITSEGNSWHLLYSQGVNQHEVIISQDTPDRWHIRFDEPPGTSVQEIYIERTGNLGWVVWGTSQGSQITPLSFQPVDMDQDGQDEGTLISQGSTSSVLRKDDNGQLFVWDYAIGGYSQLTSNQTTIAGVNVQVNVSNTINFPGASATIGNPCSVSIGGAQITLTDPPTINTGFDIIHISIHGFGPDAFQITAGSISLDVNNATGRWIKEFDRREELWHRQRLTSEIPNQQWQYDYELLGALLSGEEAVNPERFVQLAFWGRGVNLDNVPWTRWFNVHNPMRPEPYDISKPVGQRSPGKPSNNPNNFEKIPNSSGAFYYRPTPAVDQAMRGDSSLYFLTSKNACSTCGGMGGKWKDKDWIICDVCAGVDWNGDGLTEPRVFVSDLDQSPMKILNGKEDYRTVKLFVDGYGSPPARMPLVLNDDFFKFGINVGAWKKPESTIFWPSGFSGSEYDQKLATMKTTGNRGVAAISCARVGVSDGSGAWIYQFGSKEDRTQWCYTSPYNLYAADLRVRLNDTTDQIREYDFDDELLAFVPVQSSDAPASYLWDAIISGRWTNQFDGQPDPEAQQIFNMQNRAGGQFDFRDRSLQDVVAH